MEKEKKNKNRKKSEYSGQTIILRILSICYCRAREPRSWIYRGIDKFTHLVSKEVQAAFNAKYPQAKRRGMGAER